jgi:hypothetical protein
METDESVETDQSQFHIVYVRVAPVPNGLKGNPPLYISAKMMSIVQMACHRARASLLAQGDP